MKNDTGSFNVLINYCGDEDVTGDNLSGKALHTPRRLTKKKKKKKNNNKE